MSWQRESIVQCRMLSGRYRTEWLARHWSSSRAGTCRSPTCSNSPETLEHILLWCPAYRDTRASIMRLWLSCSNSDIHSLVTALLFGPPDKLLKFVLDPSTNPIVIALHQVRGDDIYKLVFHLTRTLESGQNCDSCSVIHSNIGILGA